MPNDRPAADPTRRTLLTAAAWTTPVVAVAVTAPRAAASSGAPLALALDGIAIDSDGTAAGFEKSFAQSGLQISGVTSPLDTGELLLFYAIAGPLTSCAYSRPDGTPFAENEVDTVSGVVWTVVAVQGDERGTTTLQFSGLAQTISTDSVILGPPAIARGLFDPAETSTEVPIRSMVLAAAANVDRGRLSLEGSAFPRV